MYCYVHICTHTRTHTHKSNQSCDMDMIAEHASIVREFDFSRVCVCVFHYDSMCYCTNLNKYNYRVYTPRIVWLNSHRNTFVKHILIHICVAFWLHLALDFAFALANSYSSFLFYFIELKLAPVRMQIFNRKLIKDYLRKQFYLGRIIWKSKRKSEMENGRKLLGRRVNGVKRAKKPWMLKIAFSYFAILYLLTWRKITDKKKHNFHQIFTRRIDIVDDTKTKKKKANRSTNKHQEQQQSSMWDENK